MKKILKVILILILIVFLFVSGLTLYAGNYLYDYTLNAHSQKNIFEHVDENQEEKQKALDWLKENSQDIFITNDDLKLHGYYIQQDSDIYMIMVHGYRSDATGLFSQIQQMKKKGYNLLIPDLRGHGLSEGDYIGMGWDDRKDIMKWIDFILKDHPKASIVLYGVSMGGATVMNVAGEDIPSQVKVVIEDCGYTSAWEIIKAHIDMNEYEGEIALHMASFITMVRAGYRIEDVQPLQQVKKSKIPILFIHGDQDDVVPFEMLDQLYQTAQCPKQKLVITKATHTNCSVVAPKIYYQTIFDFIEKYI